MKIRVGVTVELNPEQVRILRRTAESCGHGFDGTRAPGKLIRRYLTELVENAVIYCHEKTEREYEEDRS